MDKIEIFEETDRNKKQGKEEVLFNITHVNGQYNEASAVLQEAETQPGQ